MPTAHVIGLGRSGNAAARLLQRQGWQVTLSDRNTSAALESQKQPLVQAGIRVELGTDFAPDTAPDLVVVSPGVPWDIPPLEQARRLGIATIGEMELAWRNLQASPWVGITGTNGKTTTTALIAAIFQAAGLNAPACGNIGYAACELALKQQQSPKPPDWVIAEISSYQIESATTLAPRIGIWTTFTPDHLNRHHTLENYYTIKAKLLNQAEIQILNGDDAYLRHHAIAQWPEACWTSVTGKASLPGNPEGGVYLENGWVMQNGEAIVDARTLKW